MKLESFDEFAKKLLAEASENDFLGRAAAAGHRARSAVEAGQYDVAWRLYHEMKEQYLRHAARLKFTPAQTLALDSRVSLPMANVLRLEGKHPDALVHIIYWVAADSKVTKAHAQKLSAYLKRCEFKGVTLETVQRFIESIRPIPNFVKIRDVVAAWNGC